MRLSSADGAIAKDARACGARLCRVHRRASRPRETIGPVVAPAGEDRDLAVLDADLQAVAVPFDLVNPFVAGWHIVRRDARHGSTKGGRGSSNSSGRMPAPLAGFRARPRTALSLALTARLIAREARGGLDMPAPKHARRLVANARRCIGDRDGGGTARSMQRLVAAFLRPLGGEPLVAPFVGRVGIQGFVNRIIARPIAAMRNHRAGAVRTGLNGFRAAPPLARLDRSAHRPFFTGPYHLRVRALPVPSVPVRGPLNNLPLSRFPRRELDLSSVPRHCPSLLLLSVRTRPSDSAELARRRLNAKPCLLP